MGRKHWKTIYKELEKPMVLYSDDGHSICVLANCSRMEAFEKLKQGLKDWYGEMTDEYYNLRDSDQIEVARLRRPIREEYEDMDASFVAERVHRSPKENDVWIYDVKL